MPLVPLVPLVPWASQVPLPPPTSSGDADYRGLADTLAALRHAHPGATLRFVGDRPEAVRAAARDSRLFSVELYISEWSYPPLYPPHPGEEQPEEEPEEQRRVVASTPVALAQPRTAGRARGCARATRRPVHA